ncbi:tyrosine-protein phosphatase 1 [Chaetomidium leptoderma]|uniref:Tyrosine-protein phosphatase 1 n=1 Tax=Chaetomidium leptoderma TaxID=669021 RepID=A0AAN6VN40_9PEZI|nr:tyrosine-protein phosphatase 1 [Chaetomidium leptoderma]
MAHHLPRFHRRKKDVAAPTLITSDLPRKTTPPLGDLRPGSPMRSFQKLSPFRVFQRSSGKRARDSPPASLPHSPAAVPVLAGDCADRRPVSPLSLKTDPVSDKGPKAARSPKIPAFLDQTQEGEFSQPLVARLNTLSETAEIEIKFSELVWRERNRLMQSITNPSPDFRWARVTGPHLKVLDRYLNVQPWHNHRIKLQVPEGRLDYINASPITLTPSSRPAADGRPGTTPESDRYIAMQGPKQASTDHVWRMVVEQLDSPGVIIMLTETHEGHMEKCYPYFPRSPDDPPIEVNARDEFGDGFRATVRCEGMEETPAGDAIELRKLVIRVHSRGNSKAATTTTKSTPSPSPPSPTDDQPDENDSPDSDDDVKMGSPVSPSSPSSSKPAQEEEEPEDRIVWHFLYKKWPDFGVPSLADLDSFFTLMRLSRAKNASLSSSPSPRIVHCSAGVGRSGTFVALEHLMRELDAGVLEDYDGERARAEAAAGRGGAGTPRSSLGCDDDDDDDGGGREDLVFETVNLLREQRRTMVQAESQYLFLYRVLRQLWVEKYGAEVGGGEREREGRDGEPAAKRLEVDPFLE